MEKDELRIPGPCLVVRHTGQVLPLGTTPITFGRQVDNSVVSSDPEVSRHHAIIFWQEGRFLVQDLASANGTYLNERRISGPQPLAHGHVLRMGNTIFDVHLVPAGPVPAGAPAPPDREEITPHPAVPLKTTLRTASAPQKPPTYSPSTGGRGPRVLTVVLGFTLAGVVLACLLLAVLLFLRYLPGRGPTVSFQSPAAGAQIAAGSEITIQATARGARNITQLALSVDGLQVARSDSDTPEGQASLTVGLPWTFTQQGPHTLSAVAYTADGRSSPPVSYEVTVVLSATPDATPSPPGGSATPTPTPSPTSTPEPSPTATASPLPTPTPELLPPVISYFAADPDRIGEGECTTLEWGSVTNATEAVISPDIGGVGTPGSSQVCPEETTIYVMTATGPGGVTTAEVLITVDRVLPDLTVESILFLPSPPLQGEDNQVWITIRNAGAAAAGPFDWDWRPGAAYPSGGTVPGGLSAGAAVDVTLLWNPEDLEADLPTVARVDIGDTVVESDEENNVLQVNVEVVAPSE